MALYQPYPKQQRFHELGALKHERILMAGNQQGKTLAGSYEMACHLTGTYPEWWKGRRFNRPIKAWCAGVTNRKTRDVVQWRLFGKRGKWGTGMVPRELMGEPTMSRGLAGLIDTIDVKHSSGGSTSCWMKSYDEDVDAWASDFIHALWLDEEPPSEHYTEGLARLTATNGISYITVTPRLGMTEVVRNFFPRPNTSDRGMVRMGMKDAKHIDPADHERLLARYPEYERLARSEGIPVLGSGLVYTTPESAIRIPGFKIPSHFAKLIGVDLGGGQHPFAGVLLAWDRDTDTTYIVDTYKMLVPQLAVHCSGIRRWGKLPVAWPHDAGTQSRGDGRTYAQLMRDEGLEMLPTHACFHDGTNFVEPGIQLLADRLSQGRLRVFDHLVDWFDEYRTYHRKDGKIAKADDDLMDATRYAHMMLRGARTIAPSFQFPNVVGMDYDPLKPRQQPLEIERL